MKFFVRFEGAEDTRFVILLDCACSVGELKRRVASDFRSVFPGRPPLSFFRMASSDGFFLTDAARVDEVLEEGSTVHCTRADAEAQGAALPERPSTEQIGDVLAVFRAHVAYVGRAAVHAALAATAGAGRGARTAAEAMSVVLAVLVLEGHQRPKARAETLAALQGGLLADDGAALPAFIAAGGLFVLLHLLSPSTRMDPDPEIVEGAARLLERLAIHHGDTLAPLLQDSEPARLLHRLAMDSRCGGAARKRVLAVRRLLVENRQVSSSRPFSEGSRRLQNAASSILASGADALRPAAVVGSCGSCEAVTPLTHLRTLLDFGADLELQRQSLLQLERDAQLVEGLRELARCPLFAEALTRSACALKPRSTAPEAAPARDHAAGQATAMGRLAKRAVADAPSRTHLSRRFCELLLAQPAALGAEADLALVLRRTWPRLPPELHDALGELLSDALHSAAASSAPQRLAVVIGIMLDAHAPEELQLHGLRGLLAAAETEVADASAPGLSPEVLNSTLMRHVPRQPLLCLEVLAALSLKASYRVFFCEQPALLQLLAHCCQQSAGVSAAAGGAEKSDPAALQRAAARCLANLSAHAPTRDWVRRSVPLRQALASSPDPAVRAYLGLALGAGGCASTAT